MKKLDLREVPLLLMQIAWLAATRLFQHPVYIDDAYIHFRNALNWAQGRGLVFNPGEAVLGTTSPVYTLILGTLYRVSGVDFPKLASGFNFACEVGIVLLSLALLRRAGLPLLFRHGVVALTGFETWRMIYSHSGMEMSLFIIAILAIILFIHSEIKPTTHNPQPTPHSSFHIPHSAFLAGAGVLLGILGWIRPEGAVVWVAAALALAAQRRWRTAFSIFGLAGVLAAGICALLWVKYGTFMPQSVTAKAHAPWFSGNNGYGPVQFAITLGDLTPFCLATGFRSAWGTTGDKINSLIVMGGQIALMGFGVAALWRRGERFLGMFLPLFVAGFYAFHAVLATCIFDWYFVPYYFFALLLAGLGWWLLVQEAWGALNRRWPARPGIGRGFYRAATAALVGVYCCGAAWIGMVSNRLYSGGTGGLATAMRFRFVPPAEKAREVEYIEVAEEFNKLVPEGDRAQVGCMEIGIFGYYFHGRVLDAFGLVSPEALEILTPEVRATLPPACQAFPYDVFMHFRPKYVMSSAIFLRDQPKEFLDAYELLARPGGEDGLLCYRLRGGEKESPN